MLTCQLACEAVPDLIEPNRTQADCLVAAVTLHDGRRLELDMTMDLGVDEALAITTGQAHAVKPPKGSEKTLLGYGATGPIHGYRGTVPALEVAAFRLENLEVIYAASADGGSDEDEFLVGLGTLSRFNIVFDYPGHRIFRMARRSVESRTESRKATDALQPDRR